MLITYYTVIIEPVHECIDHRRCLIACVITEYYTNTI
jgi:hypothetical protein